MLMGLEKSVIAGRPVELRTLDKDLFDRVVINYPLRLSSCQLSVRFLSQRKARGYIVREVDFASLWPLLEGSSSYRIYRKGFFIYSQEKEVTFLTT